MTINQTVRIAAVSDLHYTKTSKGLHKDLFCGASEAADVLLLCGDLTDYGLPEEAMNLAADIHTYAQIPVIAIVGNHDFESGKITEVQAILEQAGVNLLDGNAIEFRGIGFAGICGFGGGFGRSMLHAWGEPLIKAFVQEAIEHSLRLEKALSNLSVPKRIVLLHYSPISKTVEGENPEIYPFLGSSRFEPIIDQANVEIVFHGHAHNGAFAGETVGRVPVLNVALPVLARAHGKSFWVHELQP